MTAPSATPVQPATSSPLPSKPRVQVLYNEDPPGTGKSRFLHALMVTQPCRYLYAVPTMKLLREARESIMELAAANGVVPPSVDEITSETPKVRNVPRELATAARSYTAVPHVVVLCTHEGLMATDLSGFAGWRLFIDEVPAVVEGGVFKTPLSADLLGSLYTLDPVPGASWAVVSARSADVSVNAVMSDALHRPLARLHRRVLQEKRPTIVDLQDWSEVSQKAAWAWWSMWEIGGLSAFSEVRMVGNALKDSLTKHVIDRWTKAAQDVAFQPFALPVAARARVTRNLTIHYFTTKPGSTVFWSSDRGAQCLSAIAGWLTKNAPPGDLLWSGNECVRAQWQAAGVPGTQETPVLAGINAYRNRTWAALVFSAKVQPAERLALRLFEPDADAVRRSREFEVIIQFAFRTALREDQFGGHVHLVVYDREQAEFVADYLNKHRLAVASVQYEDVGIAGIDPAAARRSKKGSAAPKPVAKKPSSSAERKQAERARKKAAKAGQTLPPIKRGRPPASRS